MISVDSFLKGVGGHCVNLFSNRAQVQGWFSEDPFYPEGLITILNQDVCMKDIEVGLDVCECGLVESFQNYDGYFLRGVQILSAKLLDEIDSKIVTIVGYEFFHAVEVDKDFVVVLGEFELKRVEDCRYQKGDCFEQHGEDWIGILAADLGLVLVYLQRRLLV